MRPGIRGRLILLLVSLVLAVSAVLGTLHLGTFARILLEESSRKGSLALQILYSRMATVIQNAPPGDLYATIRQDSSLAIDEANVVGFTPALVYVSVVDSTGRIVRHTSPVQIGTEAPVREKLDTLLAESTFSLIPRTITRVSTYEMALPLELNGRLFGSLRVGMSSALLRRELMDAIQNYLFLATMGILLAIFTGVLIAQRYSRPLREIGSAFEGVRSGDYERRLALGSENELQTLAREFNVLVEQLGKDRNALLSDRGNLRTLVDRLEDGVILLNPEGTIIQMNAVAGEVLSTSLETVEGSSLVETLGESHPLASFYLRHQKHPGKASSARLHLGPEGKGPSFLVSCYDVLDADRPVASLVTLRDLATLQEISSMLGASGDIAVLGEVASGLAHEIRNPLNSMSIQMELLRVSLETPGGDPRRHAASISTEIRRLDSVVTGFLRFVRMKEIDTKPWDPNLLLRDLVAFVATEARERGANLELDLDVGIAPIPLDRELFRQAMLNVIRNGIEAMKTGGRVRIATRDEDESVRIRVQDEGPGIPEDAIARVFRIGYSTKSMGGGLGLPIVKRIVEAHGGNVSIESPSGEGAIVTLEFPKEGYEPGSLLPRGGHKDRAGATAEGGRGQTRGEPAVPSASAPTTVDRSVAGASTTLTSTTSKDLE